MRKISTAKFGAFLEEPAFIEQVKRCESAEEFGALLKDYGAEASREETEALLMELAGLTDPGDGELNDEALEKVSGGGAIASFWILGQLASRLLKSGKAGSTTFRGSSGVSHGGGGKHFESGGGGGHKF